MFGIDDALLIGAAGASQMGVDASSMMTGDYFGRKQRSQQSKLSYELANYEAALNYQYSKLYNQQNYALAQQYAQNSAKWAVSGLRAAGLNPLLAAGAGFNASFGQAGVSSSTNVSTPSLAANPSNPTGLNVAGLLQTASQLSLNDASAENLGAQTNLSNVNAAKIQAETDKLNIENAYRKQQLERDIKSKDIDIENTRMSHGLGGIAGGVSTILTDFTDKGKFFADQSFDATKNVIDGIRRLYHGLSTSSSAKQLSTPKISDGPVVNSAKSRNNWSTEHSKRSILEPSSSRPTRPTRRYSDELLKLYYRQLPRQYKNMVL